jgi:hypothetical protein
MEAVRGEMPASASPAMGGGGWPGALAPTGWAAPHWRQNACVSPTWFPQWLQKGIY